MANISGSKRGHVPTKVIRLVLLLTTLLSLPLQAQGSIVRHDEDHLANHTMSPNLTVIGAGDLTETLAWGNNAAISIAQQMRGTRYAGEFAESCYRIEKCGRKEDLDHNACKGDMQVGFEALKSAM
jgi:hypothetical protein